MDNVVQKTEKKKELFIQCGMNQKKFPKNRSHNLDDIIINKYISDITVDYLISPLFLPAENQNTSSLNRTDVAAVLEETWLSEEGQLGKSGEQGWRR